MDNRGGKRPRTEHAPKFARPGRQDRRGASRRQFTHRHKDRSNSERGGATGVKPPESLCSVCHQIPQPKYKCPKCRLSYCSVDCCRKHKDQCSQQPPASLIDNGVVGDASGHVRARESKYLEMHMIPSDVGKETKQPVVMTNAYEDMDEGWQITDEMISAMKESAWLREELQDVGLRHLIYQIASSSVNVVKSFRGSSGVGHDKEPETEQEQALFRLKENYPKFRSFVDRLLVLTGILERQGDALNQSLQDWLDDDIHQGPLLLKTPANVSGSSQSHPTVLPLDGRSTIDNTVEEEGSMTNSEIDDDDESAARVKN